MRLLLHLPLLALCGLGFSSCIPTVYSVEQFAPLRAESSIPTHWDKVAVATHNATRFWGRPEAIESRFPRAEPEDRLAISVVYRRKGITSAGYVLPFVPLFGAYGEPESFPIVVHVTSTLQPLYATRMELRLFLDDQTVPLRPASQRGVFDSLEFVFPASYGDAERLRLEMANPLPDGRVQDIVVHFEKGSAREMNLWTLGIDRRPSDPEVYLAESPRDPALDS